MRDFLLISVTGLVLLILQTTAVGFMIPARFKPDLVLVLVSWAGLRLALLPGMGFSFGIGILVDLMSGSPVGLFALIYSLVFVVLGYLDATFDIDRPLGQAIAVFGATLFSGMAVLSVSWLSGPLEFTVHSAWEMLLKAFVGGLAAVVMIPALDRIRSGSTKLLGVS